MQKTCHDRLQLCPREHYDVVLGAKPAAWSQSLTRHENEINHGKKHGNAIAPSYPRPNIAIHIEEENPWDECAVSDLGLARLSAVIPAPESLDPRRRERQKSLCLVLRQNGTIAKFI